MNEENQKKKIISQEDIMKVLDSCYDKALQGIPHISPSVEDIANEYLKKYSTAEKACKAMIKNQIIKCTTSGFLTGFGGIITLPATLPANLTSVIYVQMRMIACVAYMAGLELNCDETQTFVYACLAGVAVNDIFKQVGIKFGVKLTKGLIEKIPGKVLTKINQKVGFRFITKFGTKGLVNMGKLLPGVGAVIGGSLDLAETKVIGDRSYKWFFEGNYIGENDIIEIENISNAKDDNENSKSNIKSKITEGGKKAVEGISEFFAKKKTSSEDEDVFETLKKLSELKEKGIISQEEFDDKKADLLSRI